MVNTVKTQGQPEHFFQDETGQWWYRFGVARPNRTRAYPQNCVWCGDEFLPTPTHKKTGIKFCSRTCSGKHISSRPEGAFGKGEHSRQWKGGRIERRGYVLIWKPDHPSLQGTVRKYVLEHRLVMEEMLGRYLAPIETVHHINGIRHDNRPENLELWQKVQPYGVRFDQRKHCDTCACFT